MTSFDTIAQTAQVDKIMASADKLKQQVVDYLVTLKDSDIKDTDKIMEVLNHLLTKLKEVKTTNPEARAGMEQVERKMMDLRDKKFLSRYQDGRSMDQGGWEIYYYALATVTVAAGAAYYYVKHVKDKQ